MLVISNLSLVHIVRAASFKISPNRATFNQNCISNVDIILDAENTPTNAADIIIDYDPTKIEVIKVVPGDVFTNYFGNIIDPILGTIKLTGASFVGQFNSHSTFATIQFKPKLNNSTATFNIRFTGANQYNTLDSNIADVNTSNDILTSTNNGFFVFTSGSCILDTTPPTITFITPINHQQDVSATANLQVDIIDSNSGVDINTVQLIINGHIYLSTSSQVTTTGDSSHYHFLLSPNDPIFTTQSNSFLIKAADFSGNSKTNSINFNVPLIPTSIPFVCPTLPEFPLTITSITPTPSIGQTTPQIDLSSPIIEFISPQSKQVTNLNPNIKINVSDLESGINPDSLYFTLNNLTIKANQTNVQISHNQSITSVSIKTLTKLTPNTDYTLMAFVSDNSGNTTSKSIIFHTQNSLKNQILQTIKIFSPSFLILLLLPLIYYFYKKIPKSIDPNLKPYGFVYNSQTYEPVQNINITVFDEFGKIITTSNTNIFGIFAFNLPTGKYRFVIYDPQYSFPTTNLHHPFDYPHPYQGQIKNIDQNKPPYLEIPLDQKHQSISIDSNYGTITNSAGQPQKNVLLQLWQTKIDRPIFIRYTNDRGQYRFIVPHGQYQLKISGHKTFTKSFDTRHLTSKSTTINHDIQI